MAKLRFLALTYKTFPAPPAVVVEVTIDVLKRMGMRVLPRGTSHDMASVSILASGWRRELDVELEAQGAKDTRMRVLAKDGVFFEENSATDLIAQVTRLLAQPPDPRPFGLAAGAPDRAAMLAASAEAAALFD